MADYCLSERARADLIEIYDFTEAKFGVYQADADGVTIRAVLHAAKDIRPQLFQ